MGDDELHQPTPTCPYCGSAQVVLLSLFGPQLLTVQMCCETCHTPFEFVKDDAIVQAFATRKEDPA